MADPKPHVIRTTDQATPQQLDAIIEKYNLPKDGLRNDYSTSFGWQSYYCSLTSEAADNVSKDSLVQYVGRTDGVQADFGRVDTRAPGDSESRDPNLWKRSPNKSPRHLRLFSKDKVSKLSREYDGLLFDRNLGDGSTIYIIDSGYNKDHTEFTQRFGDTRSIIVPNAFTGGTAKEEEFDWAVPIPKYGYAGHGTAAASVAGGATLGFAPDADLVIVKVSNGAFQVGRTPTIQINNPLPEAALEYALGAIVDDVQKKGLARKAIVSLSIQTGWLSKLDGTQGQRKGPCQVLFEKFLEDCSKEGIIFVTMAGNDGNGYRERNPGLDNNTVVWLGAKQPTANTEVASLDFVLPQRLGTDTNNLITVGGCLDTGYLWYPSTPRIRSHGNAGSVTVYAQAHDVLTASNMDNKKVWSDDGTSFAAPAVAGLIAYLFSVDTIYSQFSTDNAKFVLDVKKFLRRNAWSRCPSGKCLPPNVPALNYGDSVPSWLPAPINMAWKGYNPVVRNPPQGPAPTQKRSLFTQSESFLFKKSIDEPSSYSPFPLDDTQVVANFRPIFDPNNDTDTQIDGYFLCATNVTDCNGAGPESLDSSIMATSSFFGNSSDPSSFSTSVTPDQSTVSEDPLTSTSSTSSDASTISSSSSTISTTPSLSSSTTSSSSSSTSSASSWVDPALTTTAGDNCGSNGIDAEEGTIDSCMYQTQTAA
ncbi:MAG: hypothetical protein M1820_009311 [Bogoriella megaspora]|nr:MAG: hypothetical protein M1820_009311 [Bogoriella megaspora]